jgi:hypothetical protein
MATGKASDFKIYQPEFYSGVAESVVQNIAGFNASSQGAIRLVTQLLKGDYEKNSFFKRISGLITRRDTTSVAATTDLAMVQDEFVGVKINRKIGPVAQTLDSWRKLGKDEREMSLVFGRQVGDEIMADYINTAILSGEAAIQGLAGLNAANVAATVQHTDLVTALSIFGDRAERIVCWVMHSKPWFDLVKQSITDKIFGVANVTIYSGTAATLGRPTLVIDSPALLQAGSPNTYPILGLVQDAITVKETEDRQVVSEIVTGLENLVMRIQGEHAFNVECKGFKWDITNGGANPNDAALATGTNWDQAATSIKDMAGVRIQVQ